MSPAETTGDTSPVKPPLDLRDPLLAGILAWLVPGAGHWYQGRRTKAVLFFVMIMGAFSFGLWLGGGRVVYAAWGPTQEEKRLPYFCQLGVGAPALPALWQSVQFRKVQVVEDVKSRKLAGTETFWDWFMVPPIINIDDKNPNRTELDDLNLKYHHFFELGTVYTMIAGLLNLLVIFDACGGPALGLGGNKPGKPETKQTVTAGSPAA